MGGCLPHGSCEQLLNMRSCIEKGECTMRIAMLGLKGLPATYGGVERYAEEVATRLVARGHEVIVYCRAHYTPPSAATTYKGITLVRQRTIHTKTTDTLSHTFIASLDLMQRGVDVAHYHSLGPSSLSWLPRLGHIPTLVQIHSQEWRGATWGPVGKAFFRVADMTALRCPSATAVISHQFLDYYQQRSQRPIGFTSTGVALPPPADPREDLAVLNALGLQPGNYLLFVGRLVPEKAVHVLIEGYQRLAPEMPLVIVGDAKKNAPYARNLRKQATSQVRFLGYRYGAELDALYRQAYLYVHPSALEGLALTLLEAMAHGSAVLASDIPENLEGMGACGMTFRSGDAGDLAAKLELLIAQPELVAAQRRVNADYIAAQYSWEGVTDRLEAIYQALIDQRPLPSIDTRVPVSAMPVGAKVPAIADET